MREYAVHLFTEDGNEDVVHVKDVDAPGALVRAMREFGKAFESIVIRDEVTGMTYDCAIRGKRR